MRALLAGLAAATMIGTVFAASAASAQPRYDRHHAPYWAYSHHHHYDPAWDWNHPHHYRGDMYRHMHRGDGHMGQMHNSW
jgi:hypothetical protein